jgi:hypothetical protein
VAPIKALEPMSKASRATPSPNDAVIRVYDAAANVIETHSTRAISAKRPKRSGFFMLDPALALRLRLGP